MSKSKVCWLQLSDLHIFYSTEWNVMMKSYEELAKVFKPNFIVVTGDFCHKRYNKKYDDALDFLNMIATVFSLSKKDFFFVPGNHDVGTFKDRKAYVDSIRSNIDKNSNYYLAYIEKLQKAFSGYKKFVRDFYGDSLPEDDERIKNPESVYCIPWHNKVNIVTLNSALISDGGAERCEIIDINKLSSISSTIDKDIPVIVLAHHAPNALAESHRIMLTRLLEMMNARVYLCGDEHKLGRGVTNKFDLNNQTVGIVCGKSAVEPNDNYSDVCVIGYTWQDNATNVQVFKWKNTDSDTPYQFVKSDKWYHHVDKPFSFKMIDGDIPPTAITEQFVEAWIDFLGVFEEEDKLINQQLGETQITNKSGNTEPFSSEKIMRSLIKIGIPFPAVAEIAQKTINTILDMGPFNTTDNNLDTKKIRLIVLEAIKSLDGTKWSTDKVGNWCTKYIHRYGHNNRIIQICNIPEELNGGVTVNDANYKFIKGVFLPDLFHDVNASFNMASLSSDQKKNLADEIIAFINGCDVYLVDYSVLKSMIQEIVTKPPHPWIINDQQRKYIIEYDRRAVESNMRQITQYEENNSEIPHAIFVELLHHTSAMMLDRYFSFCGCTDFDSFSILISYFKKLIDHKFDFKNWDLMLDNKEMKKLSDDFALHGISISDYYDKLCVINPKKVPLSNDENYVSSIKDFVNVSLRIINCFEDCGEQISQELELFVREDWSDYDKEKINYCVGKILSLLFPSDHIGKEPKTTSVWWKQYDSCRSSQIDGMSKHIFIVMVDDQYKEDLLLCLQRDEYKSICNTIFFIKECYANREQDYIAIIEMLHRLNLDHYTPVLIDKNNLHEILFYEGKKNLCFDDIVERQNDFRKSIETVG